MSLLKEHIKERPALAISKHHPDKFEKRYGLDGVKTYWLTDTQSTDERNIAPSRMGFELTEVVDLFCRVEEVVADLRWVRALKLDADPTTDFSRHQFRRRPKEILGSLGKDHRCDFVRKIPRQLMSGVGDLPSFVFSDQRSSRCTVRAGLKWSRNPRNRACLPDDSLCLSGHPRMSPLH